MNIPPTSVDSLQLTLHPQAWAYLSERSKDTYLELSSSKDMGELGMSVTDLTVMIMGFSSRFCSSESRGWSRATVMNKSSTPDTAFCRRPVTLFMPGTGHRQHGISIAKYTLVLHTNNTESASQSTHLYHTHTTWNQHCKLHIGIAHTQHGINTASYTFVSHTEHGISITRYNMVPHTENMK